MNEIINIVISSASQVGIFGIAAYYINKNIETNSNKRLEEFKNTLYLLKTKELSLHDKRYGVIENLYANLVELDYSMRTLTNPLKLFAGDYENYENKLISEANEKFQVFNLQFEKNRIYFSIQTIDKIEIIRQEFYNSLLEYQRFKMFHKDTMPAELLKKAHDSLEKSYERVKDKIPILRLEIENEFRSILQVK